MSGGVWLRCDACNKELRKQVDAAMQLAVRFKPSLFTQAFPQMHGGEHRQRCRACGWVNVFVPAGTAPGIIPHLTPSWRDDIVTK